MNSVLPLSSLPPDLARAFPGARGAQAARDFEASLIASVLESVEKTFSTIAGENTSAGPDDYNYLGTQALAQAIADHGGFGIAKLITQHLPAHEGKGESMSPGIPAEPEWG